MRRSRLGSWESFEMSMYMHKCLVNELVGASKVVEVLVHWRSLGPLRVGGCFCNDGKVVVAGGVRDMGACEDS